MASAAVIAFPQPTAPVTPAVDEEDRGYLSVGKLHKQYLDFLGAKTAEVSEQKEARRYDAGAQWTDAEIATLKKRHQPVVTFNLINPKNNAVVGLVERLRQDPKCYPRTPQQQDGADLATAVLRFALDENDWKGKHPRIARFGAVDAIAGVEYDLEPGDEGDPDVRMHIVYPDTFFYDPRSFDEGFTDARFMGVSKWIDVEQAKELVPDKADEIDSLIESGTNLTTDSDREVVWANTTQKRVRLTDHWYIRNGEWRWCLYIGTAVMMQGVSPYKDERGKTFPKYRMFSAMIDQDGDRYSFFRQWKSAQDEYNHRRSKALHLMNSRRVRSTKGMVDDVEVARREEARADGWIELNPVPNGQYISDDQRAMADMRAHLDLMNGSRDMIDNFGPNLALIGQGLQDSSGRAIALLQQAGMSQLGPYLSAFKNWKIRVYRDLWNIIQANWTQTRWVRVTDDDNIPRFFQINKQQFDEYGRPSIVNDIGSLDIDIIIDEGPDVLNMQADNLGVLQSMGDGFKAQFPEIAIELAPMEGSLKKRMIQKIEQAKAAPPPPDPKVEALKVQAMLEQQAAQADLALSQQKQAADLNFQQQRAAVDAQLKQETAQMDARLARDKAAAELEIERTKAQNQMEIERFKAGHAASLNRDKARAELAGGSADELPEDDGTAPAEKRHAEAMSAMEMMLKAAAAPKQIEVIRDANNNIVGARSHTGNGEAVPPKQIEILRDADNNIIGARSHTPMTD